MKQLRITLTVGTSLRKDGSRIPGGTLCCMCAQAEKFFLTTCGGYTCHSCSGGWRESTEKGPVDWRETCLVYVLIVDPGTIAVKPLAEWVRDNFEQKCIVVTTETIDCEFI